MSLDEIGATRAVALADAGYSQRRVTQMLSVPSIMV